MKKEFSHLGEQGQVHMVNIANKPVSHRRAIAHGAICMQKETLAKILKHTHKKGDVLACARIAGIMASKKTSELIPLCHPLALTSIDISFQEQDDPSRLECTVQAETLERTGVEMEALTGLHIALLTIYDMCKAIDRGMSMHDLRLIAKSGGQSGDWHRQD